MSRSGPSWNDLASRIDQTLAGVQALLKKIGLQQIIGRVRKLEGELQKGWQGANPLRGVAPPGSPRVRIGTVGSWMS